MIRHAARQFVERFVTGVSSMTSCGKTRATRTLYKSTDGGQNWGIISAGDVYATVLETDPTLPSTLYANIDGLGLSKSTDGGITWAATGLNEFPIALAIDPVDSNTVYVSMASDTSQADAAYSKLQHFRNFSRVCTALRGVLP